MKKIAIVFGTRPEIIKLAELIRLLKENSNVETSLVYTGQHYDFNLYKVFMQELDLPEPDVNLSVGSVSGFDQVEMVMKKLVELFSKQHFDTVVAQGDTNSVLGAALASFSCKVNFAHVEAGLRSFDLRMPEEINRMIADNLSQHAFAPTELAVEHLQKTSCRKEGIALTGNTIIEAVEGNLERAKDSDILERLGLEAEKFAVLTAHRQEYVDIKENLEALLSAIKQIGVEVVFPIHPRTAKNLKQFGLWEKAGSISNLQIVEPVGYFDFLKLTSSSMFLLSDSGGVQEEASVYKKSVVVMRDNTERPEIIGSFGTLTGYDEKKIVAESKRIIENYNKLKEKFVKTPCPFGDGKASAKIAEILGGTK